MTIGAGFRCNDGIVLCADTQETYAEDKTNVYKLVHFTGINWVGGVAGAGTGYLVDYAADKVEELIGKTQPGTSEKKLITDLSDLFDRLYTNEFRKYPCSMEDKQVQLVIGLCDKSKSETILLSVDSTLIKSVPKERVIGTGELLKELAHDFQRMGLTMSQTMWVAMYLVWAAKQRFSVVGGDSLVLGIHNSGVSRIERIWDIATKEKLLKRVDSCRNYLVTLLDRDTPDYEVMAKLKHIVRAVKWSRQELREIDESYKRQAEMGEKFGAKLAKELKDGRKKADK